RRTLCARELRVAPLLAAGYARPLVTARVAFWRAGRRCSSRDDAPLRASAIGRCGDASRSQLATPARCSRGAIGSGRLGAGARSRSAAPSALARPDVTDAPAPPTLSLVLSGFRETLAVCGAALGPEVEHLDALLRPLTGAPPEDAGR